MEYTLDTYLTRCEEMFLKGERVIVAELCPDCYGLVPIDSVNWRGWSDIKTCACGNVASMDAVDAAHGLSEVPLTWQDPGSTRLD